MSQAAAGLGPGRPSRTSLVVAAARAFGAREPDESVRNPDWLAERLLGPEERALIHEHPLSGALEQDYGQARQNPLVAGTSNFMLVRTRFIDDHLERAVQNGATQIVILGAGFDTRAYRFKERLKSQRIFEVDHHATQEFKKRRLQEALGHLPDHVTFVEVDFKRDALRDVLRGAGYQATGKTFFIWEGVSMYLTEETVRETLRTISQAAPGSSLVMDYSCQATIEAMQRFPELPQHRHTTDWGEPWLFGVPDGSEREFFQSCGLELRESISIVRGAAMNRYLTRADGTRLSRGRGMGAHTEGNRWARFVKTVRIVAPLLWMGLTRRTKWCAVAELVVPPRGI